jgi:hypothetical protein
MEDISRYDPKNTEYKLQIGAYADMQSPPPPQQQNYGYRPVWQKDD